MKTKNANSFREKSFGKNLTKSKSFCRQGFRGLRKITYRVKKFGTKKGASICPFKRFKNLFKKNNKSILLY